jgi:protease-4
MRKTARYYLDLRLKGDIVEGRPEHTWFSQRSKTSLQEILEIMAAAARHRKVAAAVLKLDHAAMGWSRLSSFRRALVEFRNSGKPVYCHMERAGNAEYFLASACDQIFLSPASGLHLVGLSTEVFFFHDVLDRYGMAPQIHAVGAYKSAAEILTRTGMSAPAREQLEALLDDVFEEICRALCEGRGFTRQEAENLIDRGPYSAREAAVQRMVDGICYEDEIEKKLEERLGPGLRPFPSARLARSDGFFKRIFTRRRPQVAFIDVLGIIASGENRRGSAGRLVAGSATIAKFLDHARKSKRVRAVVMRIDSPGGSALASDAIWRGVSQLARSKPVVVSFGDIAASGGYYIAAPASCILAEPTSITGSIGVLGGKVVAQESINRLQIYRESVHRGAHAEYDSPFVPFSAEESERLQRQLEEFYRDDFVSKVAEGRKMDPKAVENAGGGRVWSGHRARDLGLVDRIGGPLEAIQEARRRAGIPEEKRIRFVRYARKRKFWEALVPDLKRIGLASVIPDPALDLLEVKDIFSDTQPALWMPFQIRIH